MVVQGNKDSIVKRHYDKMTKQSISDFLSNGGLSSKVQVDKAIFEIRGKLSSESGRRLHLYRDVLDVGSELPGHLPEPSCEQVLEAMENVEQTDNQSEEADDPFDAACEASRYGSAYITPGNDTKIAGKEIRRIQKNLG